MAAVLTSKLAWKNDPMHNSYSCNNLLYSLTSLEPFNHWQLTHICIVSLFTSHAGPNCPMLSIENGDVSQTTTVATYTCYLGYILQGNGTRICQADSNWTGANPVCTGSLNNWSCELVAMYDKSVCVHLFRMFVDGECVL